MAVVPAPHPVGCGKASLTALAKMASMRPGLPVGPDYSTNTRGPGSIELSRQRNSVHLSLPTCPQDLVPLSLHFRETSADFLPLADLPSGRGSKEKYRAPVLGCPLSPSPVGTDSFPNALDFWLHLGLPSASLRGCRPPPPFPALKQPPENRTVLAKERSRLLQPWGWINLSYFGCCES